MTSTFGNDKSFSGCDIIPMVYGVELGTKKVDNKDISTFTPKLFELGIITTISYSIHTDKRPIYPCGYHKAKAFVSGIQTIAGTMIFVVMNEHPLTSLISRDTDMESFIKGSNDISLLPPFDMTLLIGNEYGTCSILNIYGIEFIDEGLTISVNDVYSELTVQYLCRDVSMLANTGAFSIDNITQNIATR